MFQCHYPISSCPRPLPQSPKDCSVHLCLSCCLEYRVIITIFLNSMYMRWYKATFITMLDWLNTCYPQYQRALCPPKFMLSPKHSRTLSICVIFSLMTLAQAWETEWKVDSKTEARDQTGGDCHQTGSGCGDEKLFKELVWQDLQIYCECRVWERRVENECQKLKYFQFYPCPPFFLSFYFPFHLLGFTLDLLRFCLHCLGVFIH